MIDQSQTTAEQVRIVAQAIKDAIVIECHTYETYGLDYDAAAKAAIKAVRRSELMPGENSTTNLPAIQNTENLLERASELDPEAWASIPAASPNAGTTEQKLCASREGIQRCLLKPPPGPVTTPPSPLWPNSMRWMMLN